MAVFPALCLAFKALLSEISDYSLAFARRKHAVFYTNHVLARQTRSTKINNDMAAKALRKTSTRAGS